jgi:hypothetical protein
LLSGCHGSTHEESARTVGPAIIRLALPGELGKPERPAVEFDHQKHTEALEDDGCGACHRVDADKRSLPRLRFKEEPTGSTGWMQAHHQVCIDCHDRRLVKKQPSGPNDCGECHRRRPPSIGTRKTLRFDYSLHHRHVLAYGEECSACHHVYANDQQKLEYKSGTEDACSACHLPQKVDQQTPLRDAVHIACINCHIERKGRVGRTGPWLCAGCHGAEEQAKIKKLKDVPRLERGQPDVMWIAARGATTNVVSFNHLLHEARTDSCSACHHKSVGPCSECHSLLPNPRGGGFTLEQAHHVPDSTLSCVGCHKEHTGRNECAGCHHMLSQPPGQAACKICHDGPLPRQVDKTSSPCVPMISAELPELPDVSADFPEEIEIKILSNRYRPVKFPHKKIVARLDEMTRKSRLATRFHQKTETLCAGCHHNSPLGERVPACKSCHGDAAHSQKDLPNLTVAYHRQCIGCHQAIGHPAQGCTDCHEEVRK